MKNWNALYDRLREEAPSLELRRDEPMSRHTTFRIGGPAELFACPKTPEEVTALLSACKQDGLPYFILGRGSNLLVGDGGIPGLTIAMEGLSRIQVEGNLLCAQAGATLSAVCLAAREAGLAGLEFAYGIPGQVGGGVYMNAGAYGGEFRDVLVSADFLDEEGKFQTLPVEQLEMGYRHSLFTGKSCTILSAVFRLEDCDLPSVGPLPSLRAGGIHIDNVFRDHVQPLLLCRKAGADDVNRADKGHSGSSPLLPPRLPTRRVYFTVPG